MDSGELLPIGTVVILKKAQHKLMIIGYSPLIDDNKLELYDYWACFYPEGLINLEQTAAFNHKDIEKVYGVGYSDEEEKNFRRKVINVMKDLKDEKGNLKLSKEELTKYMFDSIKGGKK